MSKTCPNCGVNSPDNAKFCIECAHSLEGVPINEEEKVNNAPSDNGGSPVKLIIAVVIAVLIIIAAASMIFGFGGQKDVGIVLSDVYVWSDNYSGETSYNYCVNGFVNNIPRDCDGYVVKTIFCDKDGNELASDTKKLSYYEEYANDDYAILIASYYTPNYLDVDHVTVQIIKDGVVLNEYSAKMNTNKLTQNPTSDSGNSSK